MSFGVCFRGNSLCSSERNRALVDEVYFTMNVTIPSMRTFDCSNGVIGIIRRGVRAVKFHFFLVKEKFGGCADSFGGCSRMLSPSA